MVRETTRLFDLIFSFLAMIPIDAIQEIDGCCQFIKYLFPNPITFADVYYFLPIWYLFCLFVKHILSAKNERMWHKFKRFRLYEICRCETKEQPRLTIFSILSFFLIFKSLVARHINILLNYVVLSSKHNFFKYTKL